MLGDPRSRSKVWGAVDREIAKPGGEPRPNSRALGVSACGNWTREVRSYIPEKQAKGRRNWQGKTEEQQAVYQSS